MPRSSNASSSATPDAGDAKLIGQVAGGDLHAFELLYRGYFPRLTRFLHGMTRSVALIEEIVNDTMLVVWQKAQRFDGSCKLSTWIFAIAYRKACKAIKGLDEPLALDPELVEGDASWEPGYDMDQQQLRQAIAAALADLPPAQRIVVQLAYQHDMGYGDIAEIMDCPVNTVKTRMFHARRRLKLLLAGHQEETQ
ncbi:MAG: sigma-70 family RNA polymerase sigma factor [Pseudomonadota bacterium]